MKNLFKNPLTLLLLIVLLGFMVRLYKIDSPVADWHSWRQADTASVTQNFIRYGIDLFHPRYHDLSFLQTGIDNPQGWRFVEFPLYNAFHAVLAQITSLGVDKSGRLLSTLCATISIVFMYLLGKRFFGSAGGLLSAFFFAFLPFSIFFSRVILPEPMSIMFAIASVYFFVNWTEDNSAKNLWLSAILFALALLVKPHALFMGLPMAVLGIEKFGLRNLLKQKPLILFGLIIILPFALWRVWMSQYPEGIPHFSWMFNADSLRYKPAFWRWLFGERLGRLILGEWGLIIFAVGLISKVTPRERLMPIMFCLGSFLYVSVLAAANIRHDYYQAFVIPGVCFVLAKGVLVLWNTTIFNQTASRILVLFSVAFMMGFSWYQIKEFYKINHPEIVRAGQAVDRLVPAGAKVLAPYNGDTALLYQTRRNGWPYLTYAIEEMIQKGATHYVSVNVQNSETQDAYRKFIVLEETSEYIILKLEPKPVQ